MGVWVGRKRARAREKEGDRLRRRRSTCAGRATPVVSARAAAARPCCSVRDLPRPPPSSTTAFAGSGLCQCGPPSPREAQAGGARWSARASSETAKGRRRRKAGAVAEVRSERCARDSRLGVGGGSSVRGAPSGSRRSGWGGRCRLRRGGSRRRRTSGEEQRWGS